MASISDYTTLCQAIQDFSHRPTISPFVDYFIESAQEQITNDVLARNFGAGIKLMEVAFPATAIASDGTLAAPTDFLAPKYFTLLDGTGREYQLTVKDPEWVYARYADRQQVGLPAYIALDGSTFIFGPAPDNTYTVEGKYYQKATGLSTANTNNWLTDNAPSLLFSACMVEVGKFLKDTQGVSGWKAIYEGQLESLIARDMGARYGAGPLVMNTG